MKAFARIPLRESVVSAFGGLQRSQEEAVRILGIGATPLDETCSWNAILK
jgi:hypothetical protein